ncbi:MULTISPECIES: helix-turn-helix transcriptional regulator [Leptolyngbya]|uniref:helix-turn-helix transcriptional regulator n=1 Tax=Leptolyngbya TaxID=47251 RepID=UPI0016847B30|nr:helix-turn-helix transcriptional regulator [Leptolyngbya sp. FACHB-1624]MBD1860028.1 helix-turn-helix transcriptional regulator [Leptolyngbya sp. FACHB-1624]
MPKQSYTATSEGQRWVQEAVKYHGLTQNQIAEQANLKVRTPVSKLVNGKPVERGAFKRICNCLNLDYRVIAGLTLPSVPAAASTESSSAVSQGSVGESEDVLREIRSLQDEVKGLRFDVYRLREQDARLSQRIAPREEASDLTASVRKIAKDLALKKQDEVSDERLLEWAGPDPRLLQPILEPGNRTKAWVPFNQGSNVEDQVITPSIEIIEITEEIELPRLDSDLPPPHIDNAQSLTLPGSADIDPW